VGTFNSTGNTYAERVGSHAQRHLRRPLRAGEVVEDFNALPAYLDARLGYHVFKFDLPESDIDHLCAAHQDASRLTFFDPNSGEYWVENQRRVEFFKAMVAQYKTYIRADGTKQELTIANWYVYWLGDPGEGSSPVATSTELDFITSALSEST
jgi:hypothetical protein